MSVGTTFGHCIKHDDYCGLSCPYCKIENLEQQNSKIIEILNKIVSYHIATNSALGMKQLVRLFKEILEEILSL